MATKATITFQKNLKYAYQEACKVAPKKCTTDRMVCWKADYKTELKPKDPKIIPYGKPDNSMKENK